MNGQVEVSGFISPTSSSKNLRSAFEVSSASSPSIKTCSSFPGSAARVKRPSRLRASTLLSPFWTMILDWNFWVISTKWAAARKWSPWGLRTVTNSSNCIGFSFLEVWLNWILGGNKRVRDGRYLRMAARSKRKIRSEGWGGQFGDRIKFCNRNYERLVRGEKPGFP